jgi:hypothetical protein
MSLLIIAPDNFIQSENSSNLTHYKTHIIINIKYADVSEAAELDISEFYRVVRKQRQNKSTTPSMSYNGVTAETDNDICKLWSNYFSDLLYNQVLELFCILMSVFVL